MSPRPTALALTCTLVAWSAGARAEPAPEPGQERPRRELPIDLETGEEPEPKTGEQRSWMDDWSLLPVLFYSPETEVGFGAAAIRSLAIPEDNPSVSTIAFGVIYTTKNQFITRIEPDLRFGDDAFLHVIARYQRFPTRFFDPGAHPGDDGEPYDEKTFMGHVDGRFTLTGHLRAGLRWRYRYNDLTDFVASGALEQSGYPGLDSYFASGIGPVLSFDSRDEPRLPHRGVLAEVLAIGFADFTGSGFDALLIDLDLRGYIEFARCHVIAGELRGQLTVGDEIPFQLLPRLGGPNYLRGWYEGHLRNRHTLLAQLEWRFPLVGRVGGAAFISLGEALEDLSDFSLDKVRAGGGVGVRYLLNRRQNVTIRFDIAWGSGFVAYFDVLEAF